MDIEQLSGKGELILIVDDEQDICDIAAEMLSKFNYKTTCHYTFDSAIKYFEEHNDVSLIIMDFTIPGESALKTISKFRKINNKIKIMIMSGHLISDDVNSDIKKLNIDVVIMKPFDLQTFVREVKDVLQ